jgi:hypothetical protein
MLAVGGIFDLGTTGARGFLSLFTQKRNRKPVGAQVQARKPVPNLSQNVLRAWWRFKGLNTGGYWLCGFGGRFGTAYANANKIRHKLQSCLWPQTVRLDG